MNIRKFWITNGNNQTIQFADSVSKIFLNNPTGLGVSNTLTTNQYADKLDLVNSDQNFHQIGGEYLFYDVENKDKYEQYNSFITFLTHKPLVFYYQIPTNPLKVYSIDVGVLSIDKTEVKTDGALRCNFSLQALSRWKGTDVIITERADTIEITNDGHMPVGFEITLTNFNVLQNNAINPTFTLEQDGAIYGIAKFIDQYDTSVSAVGSTSFKSVYVNTNDGDQEVVLKNQVNAILPNPLSYQDFSISNGDVYVTFMKLARGTSTLKVYSSDHLTTTDVTVKFNPLYRSV